MKVVASKTDKWGFVFGRNYSLYKIFLKMFKLGIWVESYQRFAKGSGSSPTILFFQQSLLTYNGKKLCRNEKGNQTRSSPLCCCDNGKLIWYSFLYFLIIVFVEILFCYLPKLFIFRYFSKTLSIHT